MKNRDKMIIAVLTILVAFMDMTGIPSVFFVDVRVGDIEPFYFALMVNFLIIGILVYIVLKYLCPDWKLGLKNGELKREGLAKGLKQYGIAGVIIAIVGFMAFYVGLRPFDLKPSALKVLVEGVIYYIGVAIVEEVYVRGLLLNLIEKLFGNHKNRTIIAIVVSSVIFGAGHIFGVLNQPLLVMIGKVVWTVSMGMYLGVIYKKTNNLWLPVLIHFLINVCAIPYCFSSLSGYAKLSLYIILPAYLLLGIYSIKLMKSLVKS